MMMNAIWNNSWRGLLHRTDKTFSTQRQTYRTLGRRDVVNSLNFHRKSWLSEATMVTTTAPSTEADDFVDILIVGGGVVGSALARQLKIILPSISIGLLERGKSPLEIPTAVTANDPPNPRSYALSPTSLAILGSSTLNRISDRIAYYDSMQVWEAGSPAVLTFTNKDLVDYYHTKGNASTCQAALGAVVEDGPLVRALWQELAEASPPHIKQWTESLAINVQVPHDTSRDSVYVTIQSTEDKLPKEKLASSTSTIATRLLVGADGAQSGIRQMLGLPLVGFDYGRRAFITTVRLENTPMIPIRGRAYQRFLENGPLALLPSNLPQYATIIWSTVPEHAKELQREPDLNKVVDKLNAVLQEGPQRLPPIFPSSANYPSGLAYGFEKVLETLQYGLSLGQWQSDDAIFVVPPRIVAIEGPRFSFDLTCRQVRQYVGPRVALVGDAAHTMHPLAGQGLNLGLLDVQELVEMTASAQRSGMDLATFLSDYQQHRLRHVSLTLAGVHALHQVFGTTTSASFQHAKSLGMHFVQNLPPLKRLLAAVAAGNL